MVYLGKYKTMITTIKYKSGATFIRLLKQEVYTYLKSNNLPMNGGKSILTKYYIFEGLFFGLLTAIYVLPESWNIFRLFLYILLPIVTAGIGFNVLHDVSHGTFSSKATTNKIAEFLLLCLGVSFYLWVIKHVRVHHSKTNTVDDDDLFAGDILRLHTAQERLWFHKYQHLYGSVLYFLLYFFWIYYNDPVKYFSRRVRNYDIPKQDRTLSYHLNFWLSKVVHITLFVIVPCYLFGWFALIYYAVFLLVCSFLISIVFQLAHTVEETELFVADENGLVDIPWAETQVISTANFYFENPFLNKVLTFFVGGLNFQIEHHLFPEVSHIHYAVIQPIVKRHILGAGLPYNENTVRVAVASHFKELKRLGRE